MADNRLLLLSGYVQSFTDTGTGVESVTIYITISETGAGVDVWTLASATFAVADLGVGSEAGSAVIGQYSTQYDNGYALDSISIAFGGISIADVGVGTEGDTISVSFGATDSGAGVDVFGITYSFTLFETGLSVEDVTVAPVSGNIVISDFSFAADFAFHLQGYLRLDDFDLPHVQTLHITEQPEIEDLKIRGGSLPKRSIISKMGRVVAIEGWTDSQDDVDALGALKDGTIKVFLHPSGDSFAVLVSDVQVDNMVDDYGRRGYTLTLKETRAW